MILSPKFHKKRTYNTILPDTSLPQILITLFIRAVTSVKKSKNQQKLIFWFKYTFFTSLKLKDLQHNFFKCESVTHHKLCLNFGVTSTTTVSTIFCKVLLSTISHNAVMCCAKLWFMTDVV